MFVIVVYVRMGEYVNVRRVDLFVFVFLIL